MPSGSVSPVAATRAPARIVRGGQLFREGDPESDFFVILDGKVAIVEGSGDEERVISVHGPGRFLGELNLLTGQAVFVTAIVRRSSAHTSPCPSKQSHSKSELGTTPSALMTERPLPDLPF